MSGAPGPLPIVARALARAARAGVALAVVGCTFPDVDIDPPAPDPIDAGVPDCEIVPCIDQARTCAARRRERKVSCESEACSGVECTTCRERYVEEIAACREACEVCATTAGCFDGAAAASCAVATSEPVEARSEAGRNSPASLFSPWFFAGRFATRRREIDRIPVNLSAGSDD